MIDKGTLAMISLGGSSLDLLGALYLAYDLLGGENGPLRTLTRMVTYGALFGISLGVTMGMVFGLPAGVAHGLTLGWEYSPRRRERPTSLWFDAAMSAIRGLGYAVGATFLYGAVFGFTFGALSTVGQVIAYRFGIRPTLDYAAGTRPRLTRKQWLAALNRTVGYGVAGYLSALMAHEQSLALSIGLKAGLIIGVVTAAANACTPVVEWTADHLAPRRVSVVGVSCILAGFALQSVQYWVAVFGVPVA